MFYIQASNPIYDSTIDENDRKLMEVIETIYPMRTESAIMVWNYISIPLSYKYDISYMINDIIKVLQELMTKQEGILKINWLPDTFRCQWLIKWKEDIIEVNSLWNSVVGDISDNLNRVPSISMNKWDFVNEWERVFYNIGLALKECGYNKENLEDMGRFNQICTMFTSRGILYQNE